jgi:hypothetical protein
VIWDGNIFKIQGASDFEDAAMFNGLLVLFGYAGVDLNHFIERDSAKKNLKYVRHPYGTKYSFSRDQTICLAAGMAKTMPENVSRNFVSGRDIFSPANNGHLQRCTGRKSNWLQNLWLKAEILFHAKFTPLAEPNQLIAMMMIAGPEYLKLWTGKNSQWQRSIRKYWYTENGHWRNEKDFAEHMIKVIKELVTTSNQSLELA